MSSNTSIPTWAQPGLALTAIANGTYRVVTGNTTVLATDQLILVDTLVPISLSLPPLGSFPLGVALTIQDETGSAALQNITVARNGSDLIEGAASNLTISTNYGGVTMYRTSYGWVYRSFTGGGSGTIAVTKLPLKGDNAGNAVTQVIQSIGDANTTINAGTNVVLLTTALTAARTLTLPAATGYTAGDQIVIRDPKGVVTLANTISVLRAGGDTVNGGTGAVVVLQAPGGDAVIEVDSTGTNWGTPRTLTQTGYSMSAFTGGFGTLGPAFSGLNGGSSFPADLLAGAVVLGTTMLATNATMFLDGNSGGVKLGNALRVGWSSSGTGQTNLNTLDTAFARNAAGVVEVNNGSIGTFADLKLRSLYLDKTVTTAGTTGAQTINKAAGTVNFAAAATSLVVTNSLVTTGSIIGTVIRTADATFTSVKSVVAAAGSFTITANAGATAETSVGFWIVA